MVQRLDGKIIEKIGELVGEGVRNVDEMRRHLKIYVKDEMFRGKQQPERNNCRYFPTGKTIKNHMYSVTMKSRLSVIDQDNVQEMIELWKNETPRVTDKFFFCQYKEGSGEDSMSEEDGRDSDNSEDEGEEVITKAKRQDGRLLFVHQTAWQPRLDMGKTWPFSMQHTRRPNTRCLYSSLPSSLHLLCKMRQPKVFQRPFQFFTNGILNGNRDTL